MYAAAAAMPPNADQPRAVDAASPASERAYALFTHLVPGIINLGSVSVGIPVSVVAALIMWFARRHESPFLDDHGREATNFRISIILYSLVLVPISSLLLEHGAFAYIPVFALSIYGVVRAAMAAHRGEFYRYPMCIRFIKCAPSTA